MDLASPTIHKSGNNYSVTYGDDNSNYVEFSPLPVHQEAESELEGRPIWKEIVHVTIITPGDRTKKVCRPIKEVDDAYGPADKNRWPRQWAAHIARETVTFEGTSLSEWPLLTRSQVLEYKSINIHTVEMLANISDANLQSLPMGSMELREKAKLWLDKANGGAQISQLVKKNQELQETVELQNRQIAEIIARLEDEKPKKKTA